MIVSSQNNQGDDVMEHTNYIKNHKKGQHITFAERCKIEFLLKNKKSLNITNQDLADEIGVALRTLQREIKRGMAYGLKNSDLTLKNEYVAEYVQQKYEDNIKNKQGNLKIGKNIELSMFLEKVIINEKCSPYAALQKAKQEDIEVNICEKTLYNYIHKEIFVELTASNLVYKKKYKKKYKGHKRIRKNGAMSIEQRSDIINNRLELGHWEMDTVVGTREGKSACLLVLTERVSRKEIIRKIPAKKAEFVVAEILKLKRKYKTFNDRFKSITTDNGSEFMDSKSIQDLNVLYFYAHAYCSGERGSNENNNKFIRRFIPKGTDISIISKRKVQEIEDWINSYPRKMFNRKSANEIYLEERIKAA